MSTKIYYAWKVPLGGLKKFADKANKQLFSAVVGAVKDEMALIQDEKVQNIKDRYIAERLNNKAPDQEKSRRLDLNIRMGIVMRMARDATYSPFNSFVDLDCGITFRIHKKHAYGIGHGRFKFLDAIKNTLPAINYSYWNNTDKPNNIPMASWRRRGKIWDEVLKEPTHFVIKPVSFEITDYMTAQRIWDEVYPRPGQLNLYIDISNDKSPYAIAEDAIQELKRANGDQKVIDALLGAMPRIPKCS